MSQPLEMERGNVPGSIKIRIAQHDFPQEIVEDILSRLPVVSLLKFRCVSESWRSLIDSQRFIKIHLKRSTQNPCFSHHRIILNPAVHINGILNMYSWTSLLKEPIVNPFEFDSVIYIRREVRIVGCCNGLVCLVQNGGKFILWNPATRMSLDLPKADTMSTDDAHYYNFPAYGFGYDESSDDYKVFTFVIPNNSEIMYLSFGRIYSLKSNSWKTLGWGETLGWDGFPYIGKNDGKFVSGNLYWFGGAEDDQDIYSFDLKNEVFGWVDQPYYSENYDYNPIQTLGVIDGCLSVLCDYISHFDVWVMKEYGVKESWVNLYTILSINHPPLRSREVYSFCRAPNGEFLLIYYCNLMIYSNNPEDSEYHCSFIIDIDNIMSMGVGSYVESLVSLGPDAEEESF